jgi:hypothetical protein
VTTYDYDLIVWDTVGGAYTPDRLSKPTGGSEKEIVQLAEGLAAKGLQVACFNATPTEYAHSDASGGSVVWRGLSAVNSPLRCRTLLIQRYSSAPGLGKIFPDNTVVRANDWGLDYYQHHIDACRTLICNTLWQAALFKGATTTIVPPMLDDDYYELPKTVSKVRGRFCYISAPMKGLKETLEKWINLKIRFPNEMVGCKLHVTSPGYGSVDLGLVRDLGTKSGVKFIEDLPPRDLAKYAATCDGLFFVNTYPETFCTTVAIAEAVGARVHVLAKSGLAGIPEAVNSLLPTEDEKTFEDDFIGAINVDRLRDTGALRLDQTRIRYTWNPKDFRASTIIPKWLKALSLDGRDIWGTCAINNPGAEGTLGPSGLDVSPKFGVWAGDTGNTAYVGGGDLPDDDDSSSKISRMAPAGVFGEIREGVLVATGFHVGDKITKFESPIPETEGTAHVRQLREPVVQESVALALTEQAQDGPSSPSAPITPSNMTGPSGPTKKPYTPPTLTRLVPERALSSRNARRLATKHPPTLGLVMIAKNEVHVIERAINSVREFVDTYTIVLDRENTDDSRHVIKAAFNATEGRVLIGAPFTGLADARNEAVALAEPHSDYLLMLDADDVIEQRGGLNPLWHDAYELLVEDSGTTYLRTAIFRSNRGFRYTGVAHEILEDPPGITKTRLTHLIYKRVGGGASSATPEAVKKKYLRDAALFEEELKKHPDDTRSAFYLAQSYKDAAGGCTDPEEKKFNLLRSMGCYANRARMGGWIEEVFVSWMYAGKLQIETDADGLYAHEVPGLFLKAVEAIPARAAEPCYYLAKYFSDRHQHQIAFAFAELPYSIAGDSQSHLGWVKKPDGLFVDSSIYDWRLKFQNALAGYYVGGVYKTVSERMFRELLTKVPPEQVPIVENNLKFYK